MKKITLPVTLGLLSAANALAADLGVVEQVMPVSYIPESTYDWSGLYVGINGGHGWATMENQFVSYDDLEGLFGGVQAGYNYDLAALFSVWRGTFKLLM